MEEDNTAVPDAAGLPVLHLGTGEGEAVVKLAATKHVVKGEVTVEGQWTGDLGPVQVGDGGGAGGY